MNVTEDSEKALERFMSNVWKGDSSEDCWLWIPAALNTKSRSSCYRGRFKWGIISDYPARMIYRIINNLGSLKSYQLVCHHCDNYLCVNPKHLYLGSNFTNRLDAVRRGTVKAPRDYLGNPVYKPDQPFNFWVYY